MKSLSFLHFNARTTRSDNTSTLSEVMLEQKDTSHPLREPWGGGNYFIFLPNEGKIPFINEPARERALREGIIF